MASAWFMSKFHRFLERENALLSRKRKQLPLLLCARYQFSFFSCEWLHGMMRGHFINPTRNWYLDIKEEEPWIVQHVRGVVF
mgnify:CR=1 FL=1